MYEEEEIYLPMPEQMEKVATHFFFLSFLFFFLLSSCRHTVNLVFFGNIPYQIINIPLVLAAIVEMS